MIKITANKAKKLQILKPALHQNLLSLTGTIRNFMQSRTKSGVSIDHDTFKPYSADYLKYKKTLGKTGSKVQLVDTGAMFRSMAIRKLIAGYQIYFNDKNRAAIAYDHQIGTRVPKREWFGLSINDANMLFLKFGYKKPFVVFL